MSVRWLFMILLGCRLSHASQSPSTNKEEVISICGSVTDKVHVPCPNVTAQEMHLSLYKDKELISNHNCSYNNPDNTLKCMLLDSKVEVKLDENIQNKSFGFMLHGLTDISQGIYRCESKLLFPPPLKSLSSNVRIHLRIEGHQCKCKEITIKGEKSLDIWIWSVVVVLLTIYSLTVTIIAFTIWVKLRKADSQCDYMNTKPRAPRERRKKRGVQHPIPRF